MNANKSDTIGIRRRISPPDWERFAFLVGVGRIV
jgi:hypothetical protein